MATNQLRQEWGDVPLAEGDRGGESNETCGLSGACGQGALGLIKGAEDRRRLIIENAPRFGKSDAPRRAVEHPRTQPPLQSIHVLGHHGGRQPKRSGGRREAAFVHHPNERFETSQPVHVGSVDYSLSVFNVFPD
jgi:hypothetical protein